MPIAVVAGDSIVGERARRAGHTVAIRLVADVLNVTFTCIVFPFTQYSLAMVPVRFVIT